MLGSVCGIKLFHLGGKYFTDDKEVETEVQKWMRHSQKTSMVRVSMHG
jgi:hypothetical protein